jgi:hypothetical protein
LILLMNPAPRVQTVLTLHIIRLLVIATVTGSTLYVAPVQALELVRGVRARALYEDSSIKSVDSPENSTLGVTTYLKGYSHTRRNELRFGGQLDFSRSDSAGAELNPKLFIGNLTNIVDDALVLDTEVSLYRRNFLDNIVAAQEFDNNQNGVKTLSYRLAPTYSVKVSKNTRAEMLYSFQGSKELESVDDNQTSSHAVEAAWIRPSSNNRLSWAAVSGYKTTDFSSNDRLEQVNSTLTAGFYPRRRWFIGGLVGQDWEDLSTVQGGFKSSNRWSLYSKWNPTRRISTAAAFGKKGISGFTSLLEVGLEGPRWDVNVRWSRSSSYNDFALDPFALLTEQDSVTAANQESGLETPEVLDTSPLTLIEQQSVDEEATIAYRLSGRRSKFSTDVSYLSRNEPANDGDVNILSLRAGLYRDIARNWTVGIQHETRNIRPAAATSDDYSIYTTELSLDVKF